MIQFVKFLALTFGLAFTGTNSIDTSTPSDFEITNNADQNIEPVQHSISKDTLRPDEYKGLGISQIPLQPSNHHGCGMSHVHEVMRKEDPDYDKKLEHFTNVTLPALEKRGRKIRESRPNRSQAEVLNMPIVFHIIHRSSEAVGEGQNLTDQTIIDQLETLNEDLNAMNSGWANVPPRWEGIKGNPEMQFCLAEVDPQGNATTGIVRHIYESVPSREFIRNTIKPQTHWNTSQYYNVWIVPIPGTTAFGGVLGWAFFPGAHGSNFDGTVQDYRFTGKGGRTLTHEVGHSFGLPHVWGNSGGCSNDDGISDTPLAADNTNSIQRMSCNGTTWPTGPTTCSEEHMYINYMDYSPDACALTFTIGQGDAMRQVAQGTRASLITSANTVASSCEAGTPTGGGGNPGGGGPPITIELDAGIQNILEPVNGEFCSSETITPIVLLTNGFGDTNLTSCEIRYKISGTPGSTLFNWTGNLAKGESEEVSLEPFVSPDYSFELTAWTNAPNGGQDENGFNDERAISLNTPEVFSPNIFEDFEDETDLPTSSNIIVLDPGSTIREWELNSASAYGVGDESVYFRNFNDPDGNGTIDILEFPVVDFSEIENPRLGFDVAYYNINNFSESDTLEIRVSTDCGDSFTTVFYEGGNDLATVSAQQPLEFIPQANEWKNEVVDLLSYSGANRFIIQIVNRGYSNNNLYIDNINLSDGCASSVQVQAGDLLCADECTGFIDLILNGFVTEPQITWSNNVDGQTGESIENLCPGDYSVTVVDTEFDCEFIQEISIESPDELELIVNATDISVPGAMNGSANAQAFGGTGFYTFEWNQLPTGNDPADALQFGLSAGIYCVTVTDQAGCSKEDCVQVFGFECEMEVIVDIVQPSCTGDPGTGTITIVGANTPQIVWSQGGPPQTGGFLVGPTFNDNLQAGPLFISIIDTSLDDCEETFFFEIYPGAPPNMNVVIEDETNAGANDGSINLNANGTSEYEYEWSTGTSTTDEITDLGAGTYMVTITDLNNGCEYIETHVIENLNCTLSATADITPVTCFDDTDGQIIISATGGSQPYSYAWPSGPAFPAQFNLAAGIYPVTITDDGGCRLIVEAIVEQPAQMNAILTATDESNPGALDGGVSAQIFGGTEPYNINWSTGDTNVNMIDGLAGGLYFITVTDVNGCSTVKGASVEGKMCPEITASASSTPISCFSTNDGTASVTVTGGVEPYTYLWTPGNFTTPSIADLAVGDYSVAIMDAEGCPASAEVSITAPEEIVVFLSEQNESTLGAMDGTIESSITGGVGTISYAWSGPASFSANTPNLSLLGPGEYCLVVTDETQCSTLTCVTIGAGADPCLEFTANSVALEIADPILCAGDETASIIANVGAGMAPYSYSWSNGDSEQTATNVGAGLISVTITDANQCETIIEDFVVNEPDAIVVEAAVIGLSAPGTNDGAITPTLFNTTGTTTCTWSGPNEFVSTSCTGITDLAPGTYTLVVTDENNCELTESFEVEGEADACFGVELAFEFDITNETTVGANDGSLEAIVSGNGSAIISYEWTDQNSTAYSGNPIADLAPGLYTLVVTTENGCMGVASVEVGAGSDPCLEFSATASTTGIISCRGDETGVAEVTVEGGQEPFTYAWSNSNSTTAIATDLAAGMNSVTVTDANECTVVANVDILEPEFPLDLSVTSINESAPGANNGSASANLNGGNAPYSYVWTGPDGFTATTMTIENLSPGTYCVIATDANGCDREECATVQGATDICANANIEVAISSSVDVLDCNFSNTDLSYTATGGQEPYSVIWSIDDQTTETITVDQAGQVSILVTDANGCIGEGAIIIESNFLEPDFILTFADPSSSTALDGSAQIDDFGTGQITVEWEFNGMVIGTGLTIGDLGVGTYVVSLTNNLTGCTLIESFDLTADAPDCASFSIEVSTENVSCAGESNGLAQIDVFNGTGPFTYIWNPELPDAPIVTNLSPGNYVVTVIDANGCEDDIAFEITEPEELTVSISTTNDSGAGDGTMTANVEGGTEDYTYIWSNESNDQTIENLSGGEEFCVTIVDANECIVEACATIESGMDLCEDFDPLLTFTNQITCFEANDGALQVNIDNPVEPITFEWSNGLPSTQQQTDLGPGVYSVTVTDGNNCTYVAELELTQPESELVIELSSDIVSSPGAADGSASVLASGGNEGIEYTYIWDDPSEQTTATATGLSPGEYCVTVGSGNCSAIGCIEVFDAENPCIDFTAEINTIDILCFGECSGIGEVITQGGSEPYAFVWSDGVTGQNRDDLCGSGSVTISDANDCTVVLEFLVDEPNELDVVASSMNSTTSTSNDGSANAAGFGGTPPYTYNWGNAGIGSSIENLEPGTYTVTVSDANDCRVEASVVVGIGEDECSGFQGALEIENVSCFGGEDGSATVIAEGGFGPLLYDWSNSNTLGFNQNGMVAGDFEVIVRDQNGCEIILQGTITEPSELIINILDVQEASDPNISDGSATVEVMGGTGNIDVSWSNGAGEGLSVENLAAGTYTVTAEDENGCITTETVTIASDDPGNMNDCESLTASFAITPVSCFNESDGSIVVTPSGGTEPYEISSSSNSLTNLPATLVVITVEDAVGCIFEQSIEIPSPSRLTSTTQGFDGTCGLSGSAEVIVSGGTAPFVVSWSNGDFGPFINGLESGTYSATVIDANGCSVESDPIEVVTEFDPLSFEVFTNDASCDGGNDGFILLDILNSNSSNVTFLWSDGATTEDRQGLAAGSYTVTITDELGCQYILSREVQSPGGLNTSYTVEPGSTSDLFNVTLSTTGGSSPYTYEWSDGSNGFFNTGITEGEYQVVVTDANGCMQIVDIILDGTTTSVLDNLDIITEFDLSPNPTTGAFFLDLTLSEVSDIQISVYDILGQEVINNAYRASELNERLDLENHAAGTYFVRVYNQQGQVTKKLIKVD